MVESEVSLIGTSLSHRQRSRIAISRAQLVIVTVDRTRVFSAKGDPGKGIDLYHLAFFARKLSTAVIKIPNPSQLPTIQTTSLYRSRYLFFFLPSRPFTPTLYITSYAAANLLARS